LPDAVKARKVIPDTINALQRIGGSLENIDHEIGRIYNLNKRLKTSLGMSQQIEKEPQQPMDGEAALQPGILEDLELIARDKQKHAEIAHKDLGQEINELVGLIDIILGPQDSDP